jgi:hypothetical protein
VSYPPPDGHPQQPVPAATASAFAAVPQQAFAATASAAVPQHGPSAWTCTVAAGAGLPQQPPEPAAARVSVVVVVVVVVMMSVIGFSSG